MENRTRHYDDKVPWHVAVRMAVQATRWQAQTACQKAVFYTKWRNHFIPKEKANQQKHKIGKGDNYTNRRRKAQQIEGAILLIVFLNQ
ncbi:chloride channel protein [Sesbania bispinosa]|nr:chloride channel protein [Sesbania bispinosa]